MIAALLIQIVNGLILGSIYALAAAGVAVVYGTMRVLNFANGEFYMLGGFATFYFVVSLGLHPALGILIAAAVIFLFGMVFQVLTIRPLLDQEGALFSTMAVTLGAAILFQNGALRLWGEQFQSVPYYIQGELVLDWFRLPYQRLLILGGALLALAVTGAFLKFSRTGRAIRAVSQDPEAAAILGVPAATVQTLTFGLGVALAAIAAGLLAPIYSVNPWMGVALNLKAFVVVILGGLGSFGGAIAAGFILGVVESLGVYFTSAEWQEVISFAVLILVILVRPWGLFGRPQS